MSYKEKAYGKGNPRIHTFTKILQEVHKIMLRDLYIKSNEDLYTLFTPPPKGV